VTWQGPTNLPVSYDLEWSLNAGAVGVREYGFSPGLSSDFDSYGHAPWRVSDGAGHSGQIDHGQSSSLVLPAETMEGGRISFRYRVDAAPTDRVTLAVGAEDPASQHGLDLTPILTGAASGQWQTVKVRLSCFRDAGADLTSLERPFQLTTSGRMTLSVSEIRLASNEGDAICPSQ
jgi:hypothetical protein